MQKKFFQKHLWPIIFLLFLAIGIFYAQTSEKIYSSKSQVALFRLKIEGPESGMEESRNRWIWIRDGLNIKSALMSDDVFEKILETDYQPQLELNQEQDKQKKIDYLKTLINIQYTGADENNYLIEVHAPTTELSLALNNLIFERLKYFAVEEDHINFLKIIAEVKEKQEELKNMPNVYSDYQDKLNKMIFTQTIEQKQRENAFHVISKPTLNNTPIWPNTKLIIISFGFIGIVIGLCIEYIARNIRAK